MRSATREVELVMRSGRNEAHAGIVITFQCT